jgi:anti-sigma B factor antagonist
MPVLEVTREEDGSTAWLSLVGELDLSSAPRVEKELHELESGDAELIVLDLRELSFLDSTGLRLIVTADARARDSGRRLAIVQGPEAVERVFRVTGLDALLEIVAERSALEPEG